MFKQNKQAFTLVELIVVITILAILGTIAFISLQGYSKDARDSVRTSDISRIKTSLELFQLDAGKYPEVTNANTVTYSGALAWTQGEFGEATFNNVDKLDKIPLDPITDRKYTYSITNTKQEYQVAGLMESADISYLNKEVNAATKTATLKISGNYNGKILKVSTGGLDYVLAVPSIITSDGFDVKDIADNDRFAYNGYKNLPASYAGSSYEVFGDAGIDLVDESHLILFEGQIGDLSKSEEIAKRKEFLENIQLAYTGTTIAGIGEIAEILNISGDDAIESLASTIVSNDLGGSVVASVLTPTSKDWDDQVNYFSMGTLITYSTNNIEGSPLDSVKDWDTAFSFCDSLSLGGKDDWYLPTKDELNTIYTELKLNNLGNLYSDFYRSGTEFNSLNSWRQFLGTGQQDVSTKVMEYYTRCVRQL